jgi:hypothetical protein
MTVLVDREHSAVEVNEFFFRWKEKHLYYNFLDRIPKKSMERWVERHGNANDNGRNILMGFCLEARKQNLSCNSVMIMMIVVVMCVVFCVSSSKYRKGGVLKVSVSTPIIPSPTWALNPTGHPNYVTEPHQRFNTWPFAFLPTFPCFFPGCTSEYPWMLSINQNCHVRSTAATRAHYNLMVQFCWPRVSVARVPA